MIAAASRIISLARRLRRFERLFVGWSRPPEWETVRATVSQERPGALINTRTSLTPMTHHSLDAVNTTPIRCNSATQGCLHFA
jgi:hypothetical protein